MKLLSWNVNGRVGDAARRQSDAVLDRSPDLIALQEVTPGSYEPWCEDLTSAGYAVLSTIDLVALPYPPRPIRPRRSRARSTITSGARTST